MNKFKELRLKAGLSVYEAADLIGCSYRTIYRWEDDNDTCEPKNSEFELLKNRLNGSAVHYVQETGGSPFTYIDLFAGIGGFRQAFDSAGGRCVFTSEWDKHCVKTYLTNFPDKHPLVENIKEAEASDIPPHDLLVAGFPCQPFSIAGVSKKNSLGHLHGFKDMTQGTLFYDIQRIIDYHRPRAFLLENVKNLLHHDRGKTFTVIRKVLQEELGYQIDWKVIDAKGFVPQHRERLFIAGFLKDTGFRFSRLQYPNPLRSPKLDTVLHPEDGTEEPEPPYTLGNDAKVNEKYTLSENLWNYLQNYAKKHRSRGNGFGFGLVGPNDTARTLSARYFKDGSEILVEQKGNRPRRLTPRECSRLMGFDEAGKKPFEIPVSDTQAYKQFGNAVVVPVARHIAEHMKPHITGEKIPEYDSGQLEIVLE